MILPLAIALSALVHDSAVTKSPDSLRLVLPRTAHRPVLDGVLDDAVWKDAAQLRDFIQGEPKNQAPPLQPSIGYVAYDSEYFYFAFRAYEREPSAIRSTIFPRERGGEADDRVTILLDTFLDRRRVFEFMSTPKGIQADGIKLEGQPGDRSPDFVWYSAGRVDDEGWVVEMMIPWASLRFPARDPLSIGFNAVRVYGRNGEKDSWAPRRKGNPCDLCQEGVFTGITGISTRRAIDLYPYVAASQLGARSFGRDSVFRDERYYGSQPPLGFSRASPRVALGADLRIPLTSALVLNATLNPDFSQVEADDDQIRTNQRFTLFQSERRPFFLEGRDAFESGYSDEDRGSLGSIFYSRAIVDPDAGLRAVSKQNGLTLAGMYARDHSPAHFYYQGYESSGFLPLEQFQADVVAARARKDLLADSYAAVSVLGRRLSDASNTVLSSDFSLRRGQIIFSGEGAGSSDRSPFAPLQNKRLDGVSRSGRFYRAKVSRSGHSFGYNLSAGGTDSLFRDQLGRFARVGVEQFSGRIDFTQYPNNKILQRIEEGVSAKRVNRFRGGLLDFEINPRMSFQFQRQTSLTLVPRLQRATLFERPVDAAGTFMDFKSEPARRFGFGGTLYIGGREIVDPSNPRAGKGYVANLRATLRPVQQASIELRGQRSTHVDHWGDPLLDDARILRMQGTYQFARAMGLRIIAEHSNQFSSLVSNPLYRRTVRNAFSGLFSYELGPASFLYVGYNEGEQEFYAPVVRMDQSLKTGSQLFMKLSYLFRR